jgi:rhomboid protease GluP
VADDAVGWAPGISDPKIAFEEFKLHLLEITPHLRVVPVVVVLNVLAFGAMVATGISALHPSTEAMARWGADYGPLTLGGQPWRLLTSIFLHVGIIHLAANMVALLSAGPVVERLFGSVAFGALYLAAGIAGSVASLAVRPLVVSAGASGAIFGVYGALGAVMLLHRETIPPVALKKLGGVAASFIIYNFSYAINNFSYAVGRSGIDNMAHLGGLVGGALAGVCLFRPLVPGRPERRRRPALVMGAACLLAGVVLLVFPRPLGLDEIVQSYLDDEAVAQDGYKVVLVKMNKGEMDSRFAADYIENGILSDWRQTRAKLEGRARNWSSQVQPTAHQKRLLELMQELAAGREDAWTQMVAALRANDVKIFSAISQQFGHRAHGIIQEMKNLAPD